MRRFLMSLVPIVVLAPLLGSCADDTTSTTSTTTSSSSATTSATSTTSTTTTAVPGPVCDSAGPLTLIADALSTARLPVPRAWDGDPADTPFAERTTTAHEYAARLGLDCGLLVAAADAQTLAILAWTGTRTAYAVQTTAPPSEAYRPEAFVRNPVSEGRGEFLVGDMSSWAVTGPDGESIVLGHVDFSLGAASKGWEAGPRLPFEEEIILDAEQHAIDALQSAGMRNAGLAQSAEFGSEEGYAQFVSTTGQISVADVAPTGWFDPMTPRYYSGDTTIESIDGVDVRITIPNPDDNLGFVRAAEVAFACDEFVWILEPPINGTVDEMVASATAVIGTEECRG